MVADIRYITGGHPTMPGDYGCFDDRIRNWDEEWVSQLLEEALRLKQQFGEGKRRRPARSKPSDA